ncbi:hypothetical protein [Pseudoduganella armeniaca]|uniref:Peptidase n=1 Tax=Pseudoduganella armeniaca TaxID=2072590 RepID=A0A2R4CF67_9BURK|nr:hypothetical protein [Pseudoduganella armeniaca]AVR98256.1 hypothetical protein C9I28_23410 [Pseudoduganella armeniaca]
MFKILPIAVLSLTASLAHGAQLTALETRWLNAAAPVIGYAKSLQLPLDIVVQPQAGPNDVPLAMGYADGRCKLVLSMRGNPNAETILQDVPEGKRDVLIEAMAAHEMGHCWRIVQGSWHALPAGFTETGTEQADDPTLLELSKQQRQTRREEGFSDLVALAWTQRSHPAEYGHVYSWLRTVRDAQPHSHGSHDTRAWLKLAAGGNAFGADGSPFEQVAALWRTGLLQDE